VSGAEHSEHAAFGAAVEGPARSSSKSKMSFEIHPNMQNSDYLDIRAGEPIEQDMRFHPELEITSPNIIASASAKRMLSQIRDGRPQPENIVFSLLGAPSPDRIIPDLVDIAFGAG
jgi:hypothetical protein